MKKNSKLFMFVVTLLIALFISGCKPTLNPRINVYTRDTTSGTRDGFFTAIDMVSKGKVVNRDTMISTLWGGDVILETRTIDMHIRSLRNKLDEGFILTIHGVGYKVRL